MRRFRVLVAASVAAAVLASGKASGQEPTAGATEERPVQLIPLLQRKQQALFPVEQQGSAVDPDPLAQQLLAQLRTRVESIRSARRRLSRAEAATLESLRREAAGDVRISVRSELGTPRQIRANILFRKGKFVADSGVDPEVAIVWAFFGQHRDLLRLDRPREELVLVRKEDDPLGGKRLRFRQAHRGLPVWPSGLVVRLDEQGNIKVLDASYVPTPRNAVVQPVIDGKGAVDRARASIGTGQLNGEPQLILWLGGTANPRLAWRVRLRVSLVSEKELLVSAIDGSILLTRECIARENVVGSGVDLLGITRTLNVWHDGAGLHFLWDTSKPMFSAGSGLGVIYIADTQNADSLPLSVWPTSTNPDSWPVADSVSAAWGLGQVYDYYLTSHGRNSFDGAGADIWAFVRVGNGMQNAFWDAGSRRMIFGDGDVYAGSLDVVGHEMTHAVISYSADLHYYGQSGALNESFADIFGELVERFATGSNDWLIGSALSSPGRNMKEPGSLQYPPGNSYPSRMSQFVNTSADQGGVHINSSIINHCFYQLAEGMPNAIGPVDAGRIFYRALTAHLTSYAQFKDARIACVTSAEELFGANSSQAQTVSEAFDLVEVGVAAPSPGPADYNEVAGPDSTLFLFVDAPSGNILLGRRDTDEGDGVAGISLDPTVPLAAQRIAVSGNGQLAACVTADNDLGLVDIYGAATMDGLPAINKLGFPGTVYTVTVDPSGERYAFVLLDGTGNPTNQISVVDVKANTTRTFELEAATQDGGSVVPTVDFAEAMAFTADGRFLIYDALNELTIGSVTLRNWSIYALDLLTETTLSVVPPFIGLDIGNPSLSQTSDGFLTFEVFDQLLQQSTVYAGDLNEGTLVAVATVTGGFPAFPSYTGDDAAIIYEVPDSAMPTGLSILHQPVAGRLTPTSSPTTWIQDAARAVIYRRGVFVVPNSPPDATIDTPVSNVTINQGQSVQFSATGNDVNGHLPLAFVWDFDGGATSSFVEDPGAVRFDQAGVYTVRLDSFDSEGLADPSPALRTVTVLAPPPPPSGGGGGCAYNPNAEFDPTLVLMIIGIYVWAQRRRWV